MMICFASSTFAQEVRGVESKLVVYDGPEYEEITDTRRGSPVYSTYTEWIGYSFLNMNSIPVSVDVELYEREEKAGTTTLISTKSFVLQANESYIWKHENNISFRARDGERIKAEPYYNPSYSYSRYKYFIKYKAYKLL